MVRAARAAVSTCGEVEGLTDSIAEVSRCAEELNASVDGAVGPEPKHPRSRVSGREIEQSTCATTRWRDEGAQTT